MLHPAIALPVAAAMISACLVSNCCAEAVWSEKGSYSFSGWAGPSINVFYSMPPAASPETPILLVVPGAKRNADVYRDAWHQLALANGFIVLTIEGKEADFPSEYEYNAGGVITSRGEPVPEKLWAYSAIEPLFDDFKTRFGSQREKYSLYGHSAGGQFVLTYLLFKPDARVERAVAANPAFCMMPNSDEASPFGLRGAPLPKGAVKRWLASPTVLLLGDGDLAPRTKPLSNGPIARAQGPHVFARGLAFYRAALIASENNGIALHWKLEIVQAVGHSNEHMASHAVKYLFGR